jgi:hypothetical protein
MIHNLFFALVTYTIVVMICEQRKGKAYKNLVRNRTFRPTNLGLMHYTKFVFCLNDAVLFQVVLLFVLLSAPLAPRNEGGV